MELYSKIIHLSGSFWIFTSKRKCSLETGKIQLLTSFWWLKINLTSLLFYFPLYLKVMVKNKWRQYYIKTIPELKEVHRLFPWYQCGSSPAEFGKSCLNKMGLTFVFCSPILALIWPSKTDRGLSFSLKECFSQEENIQVESLIVSKTLGLLFYLF